MSFNLITVSIIINAYDKVEDLPATVNSILQQTYTDFEITIFGDRSCQQTLQWFGRIKDPRLEFIFQKNLGIAQTLNRGILEAKGEYICFASVGDLWHPSKLQRQIFYLRCHPQVGLIHSPITIADDRLRTKAEAIKREFSGWIEPQIIRRNLVNLYSVMVRRCCFETVGIFDSRLEIIPDWDLWIRLSRRYQFLTLAEPLVCQQNSSNTANNWSLIELDFQATIEKAYSKTSVELQDFKDCSYAYASLDLAWRILRDRQPDLAIANNYCHQALHHFPSIGFAPQYIQARLAIATLSFIEKDRHTRLLWLIQMVKRWLEAIIKKTREYGQGLLIWLLEEESFTFWRNQKIRR